MKFHLRPAWCHHCGGIYLFFFSFFWLEMQQMAFAVAEPLSTRFKNHAKVFWVCFFLATGAYWTLEIRPLPPSHPFYCSDRANARFYGWKQWQQPGGEKRKKKKRRRQVLLRQVPSGRAAFCTVNQMPVGPTQMLAFPEHANAASLRPGTVPASALIMTYTQLWAVWSYSAYAVCMQAEKPRRS